MDAIVITGNGPLKGETYASGAKNAALPIIASALLAPGEHTFRNVPG
ncbi:MAG: UDP-N-acetylglucosamine 1-carboxyvinyltransferase, partial [Archangium sp.]|nr:UDP-N-acetylglucosamine 1-carboxyvinyltransferase [Archangium sp.]